MKKISLLLTVILLIGVTFLYAQKTEDNNVIVYPHTKNFGVGVYYFHGNFRCSNCYKIEKYSKEAVEKYFSNELKSGRVVYKVINIDEPQNEHFIDDYKLYTKSVIVSLVKNGKEIKYNNLTKVWEFLWDKDGFYNYVREEVDKYLKES